MLAVLIMDIVDNLLSETSPLNTQLDENELAGCSNDSYIDSASEPEDEIPSYQPIQETNRDNSKEKKKRRKQENKSGGEISNTEITFLDTVIYKGKRFRDHSILDTKTHFKPTETFQYTHFSSSHPSGVKKGFVKGEALRLLRTNSSRTTFEENIYKFKSRLLARGYPKRLIDTLLSDVRFTER